MTYYTLPQPDQYGNYWLGKDHKNLPVILKGSKDANDCPPNVHRWFIIDRGGVAWDGPNLKYFDSPEQALSYLEGRS